MKKYGLIGYPLGHSFSKQFFQKRFKDLDLNDHSYELFEIDSLDKFPDLWKNDVLLKGVNVTIPHKENITQFLDHQDQSSLKVGATNVIVKRDEKLIGYNTDYFAFKESLRRWISNDDMKALVLGSGGASKAVKAALKDLDIEFQEVSRKKRTDNYTYEELTTKPQVIQQFQLIINTTPLGTFPNNDSLADLPYHMLTCSHYLYDLVYNPEETAFMKKGIEYGAKTKNGLEMLELQAEKSWDIWNNK
ncbi:MAG: shikimate dehydrogenase [Ekhidna sp.]